MNKQKTKIFLSFFQSFGNLLMGRKNPPWKKEKQEQDKLERASWQYNVWKYAVLRRDKYACVACGDDRRSKLQVHHIKPFKLFPELRYAIDNGKVLCEECHKKTETYGAKVKKWKRRD